MAIFSAFSLPAVNGTSINGDEINCSGKTPPRFKCLVFLRPGVTRVLHVFVGETRIPHFITGRMSVWFRCVCANVVRVYSNRLLQRWEV